MDLEDELQELRDKRLDGEDISQSDNREKSIEADNDQYSQQSITSAEKQELLLLENAKLMGIQNKVDDLLD